MIDNVLFYAAVNTDHIVSWKFLRENIFEVFSHQKILRIKF